MKSLFRFMLISASLLMAGGLIFVMITDTTNTNYSQINSPYPLNMEIHGVLGDGSELIQVVSKVSYDGEKYKYNYKISCPVRCLFTWELLDKMIESEEPIVFELEPNKEYEFSTTSEKSPVMFNGQAWLYRKIESKGKKGLIAKYSHWVMFPTTSQPGPLPL